MKLELAGKRLLVLFLTLGIFLFSLTSCGATPNSVLRTNATAFNGKTLYQGLFFGEGPAAKLMPEIWQGSDVKRVKGEMTKEQRQAAQNIRSKITRGLTKENPSFFKTFAREVQSGNPVRVEGALVNAFDSTRQVSEKLGFAKKQELSPQQCGPTFCVLAIAVAVVVYNYAAVVHSLYRELAIRADVAVTKGSQASAFIGDDSKPLTQDRVVALITTRYAIDSK